MPEAQQGAADLNGDGDASDHVAHALPVGGNATNLGLAVDRAASDGPSLASAGPRAAIAVSESAQAASSLNGDADAADRVLHLFEADAVANLGLDVQRLALLAGELVFEVREPHQGASDLDADGDAQDDVLHVLALGCGPADPDPDGDGVCASADNCPYYATSDLTDTDEDGRGDPCECGDQDGDGRNTVSDLVAINRAIFEPGLVTPLCDANGDGRCDVGDIVAANLEIFSPTSSSTCARQPVPGP